MIGPDHNNTIATSANLAVSLGCQDKHTEAVEILREILVSRTRLFGAWHEKTLSSARNRSVSLSQCDPKAKVEQLFPHTCFAL